MNNDTAAAHRLQYGAEIKRKIADGTAHEDPTGARWNRIEAAQMERTAEALLTLTEIPIEGAGGELTVPSERMSAPGIFDTVKRADMVTLQASHERIGIADEAGVFNLAFDAADAIKARDSVENMLAHQLAASHKHAMKLLADSENQRDPVERARLVNAAARLMAIFQPGMIALGRYRSGGKQTVSVQHNHVQGGQAVITGAGDIGEGGAQK